MQHLIDIGKIDIDKIIISSKDLWGRKGQCNYFIGYITNYIKPLCIKLSQMNRYVKYFNDNTVFPLISIPGSY